MASVTGETLYSFLSNLGGHYPSSHDLSNLEIVQDASGDDTLGNDASGDNVSGDDISSDDGRSDEAEAEIDSADVVRVGDTRPGRPRTVHTGISTQFGENSDPMPEVAFRELYQNFRDGIADSNSIHLRELDAVYEEKRGKFHHCINIRFFNKDATVVRHYKSKGGKDQTERLLYGYVQFQRKVNENRGIVRLVNFGAKLEYQDFKLWQSVKEQSNNQAGRHGEGMKQAAKHLCGAGYSLLIDSGCLRYRFRDICDQISITWKTISVRRKKGSWEEKGSESKRPLDIHGWEDIAVTIGSGKNMRNTRASKQVREETFKQWLDVTCDIHGPTSKVTTDKGDLMFDERFRGHIYLMGLKLSHSAFGKQLRYGYNFYCGDTGRERVVLEDSNQEAELVQSVWAGAIDQFIARSENEQDCVDPRERLLDMFQNHPDSADVEEAEHYMEERIAKILWEYLVQESKKLGEYYVEAEDEGAPKIVRDNLKLSPKRLNKKLWEIFRRHRCEIRTANEERNRRFERCEPFSIDNCTPFGLQVWRIFSAMLSARSLDGNMPRNIQIKPVKGAGVGMLCLYLPKECLLLLNADGALDYNMAHRDNPSCFGYPNASDSLDTPFMCDHHVIKWHFAAVEAISIGSKIPFDHSELLSKIANGSTEWLRLMPRAVSCTPTDKAKEIKVSWQVREWIPPQRSSRDAFWVVEIHAKQCEELERGYVTSELDNDQVHFCECGGQCKVADASKSSTVFQNAEPGPEKEYCAVVALNYPLSIVARTFHSATPLVNDKPVDRTRKEDETTRTNNRSEQVMADCCLGPPFKGLRSLGFSSDDSEFKVMSVVQNGGNRDIKGVVVMPRNSAAEGVATWCEDNLPESALTPNERHLKRRRTQSRLG